MEHTTTSSIASTKQSTNQYGGGGGTNESTIVLDDDIKESLKKSLQEWVANDNEIRALNVELARRKKLNRDYTNNLIKYIKKTDIETIDIKDGYVSCISKTQKKPISNKFLNDVLGKYYNGNMEQVENLTNYIGDNREIVTKNIIVRKIYDK